MTVSDKPWSNFSAADYSVEQWHRACLVHDHEGAATSKDQCKLPVREPDGTINKNGVHAAAAALAGARGGVKLSVSEKIAAHKAIRRAYAQIGEKPPAPKMPSFMKHDDLSPVIPPKSLCIVALPTETDVSRTVGAEEKHATLLNLGDDVASEIADLVQASVQEFIRRGGFQAFSETVSSVATLGDNGARAWMIDSNNGLGPIREQLLRQPAIRSVYDTVAQFPNFTPHVTIGYPEHKLSSLSDFEENKAALVRQITFDRIAIWYGEKHRVIWRLPSLMSDSSESDMEHADPAVEAFLAHVGIKGMKWGIRRPRGSDGTVEGGVKEAESKSSGHTSGGTHLSADAERMLHVLGKKPEEMSTRDLQEVTKRAEALKKYNELFGEQPHKDLQTQLAKLQLQNNLDAAKATYSKNHPSPLRRMVGLISHVGPGFALYKKFAGTSEGKKMASYLTDEVRKAFNLAKNSHPVETPTHTSAPKKTPFTSAPKRPSSDHTTVHDITSMGKPGSPHDTSHVPQFHPSLNP